MAAGYEFSVGEKVAFVDEDIKGVVKSVSGENVVITTSDGFEYECSPREIVSQEIAEKGLSDFIKDKDWDYVTHDKYAERRRPTPPSNKARREPRCACSICISRNCSNPPATCRPATFSITRCVMPAPQWKMPARQVIKNWCSYTE